ncbi:MAG: hypothetical protein E6P95_02970 [Candidatus Moraniibacteriota bacterium]|nr:MAG: hypothetical protein E6P95_02970 [Candidatus Moranbacteria bacterium]
MPEQLSLPFEPSETPKQGNVEVNEGEERREYLNTLSNNELEALFKESVGYDARTRFVGNTDDVRRKILIDGIIDPIQGKDSVTQWDADYDKVGDAWSRK